MRIKISWARRTGMMCLITFSIPEGELKGGVRVVGVGKATDCTIWMDEDCSVCMKASEHMCNAASPLEGPCSFSLPVHKSKFNQLAASRKLVGYLVRRTT
jgi:hypothetical protein